MVRRKNYEKSKFLAKEESMPVTEVDIMHDATKMFYGYSQPFDELEVKVDGDFLFRSK